MALFLFASTSAEALTLDVKTPAVPADERVCFQFQARQGGEPVENALVRFTGRERTDERGRAEFCRRLEAGRHLARALKGDRRDELDVRARESQPQGPGEWRYVHSTLVAIGGQTTPTQCFGSFGRGESLCSGTFQPSADSTSPFSSSANEGYGLLRWSERASDIRLRLVNYMGGRGPYQSAPFIEGTVPNRSSNQFTVTKGSVPQWGAANLESGTDASKTGRAGGPLSLSVDSRSSDFNRYVIDVRGWVRTTDPVPRQGSYHPFGAHVSAWSFGNGTCWGTFSHGGYCSGKYYPEFYTLVPFNSTDGRDSGTAQFAYMASYLDNGPMGWILVSGPNYLAGWLPSPNSPNLVVTDGDVPAWGPGATRVTTPGLDPTQLEKPGGPVGIDVQGHEGGYSVFMRGYVWY